MVHQNDAPLAQGNDVAAADHAAVFALSLIHILTDDSFGSLTVEQMQKFSDHFKVPEQFVKLGDKIVAIPMISKEQQKQEATEQKDFEMNADTSGLTVA